MPHLQTYLKEAGFDVIEEGIKVNWTPKEEDLEKVPVFVEALLK